MPAPPIHIQTKLRQAFDLLNAGRDDEARKAGKDILKSMPREPNALYLLGVLHHKAGDLKEAARFFEKSYAADRSNLASYSGIGIVRLDQSRFAEAAKIFEDLRRAMPRDPVIANNLGLAYKGLDRHEAAVGAFEAAIALGPDYADAYANLGALLTTLGDNARALDVLQRGRRISPKDPSILLHLGSVLAFEPELQPAIDVLKEAVAADPKAMEPRWRLASLLVNKGEFDAARDILDRLIEEAPDDPTAYFDLADLLEARSKPGDDPPEEYRRRGLAAHERSGAQTKDVSHILSHRIAQSYEAIGAYDKAFRFYSTAQNGFRQIMKAAGKEYDPAAVEDLYDGLIDYFSAHPMEPPARFDARPIFIVGMPRSGTSLLEQVLASHPAIFGAGELMTVPELVERRIGDTDRGFVEFVAGLDSAAAEELAREYLDVLPAASSDARFVTDKLPANFLNVGLIRRMFPNALILNTLRHPLDVGWSVFVQKFGNHLVYDHDLTDIGHYYAQYDRLMKFWRDWDSSIIPVRYEDMVSDMQATIMPVIEALGLTWDPAMARFFENDREVRTASRLQVRRPIYTSSVARWKRFEQWLGPMLDQMGSLPGDYEEGNI